MACEHDGYPLASMWDTHCEICGETFSNGGAWYQRVREKMKNPEFRAGWEEAQAELCCCPKVELTVNSATTATMISNANWGQECPIHCLRHLTVAS